MSPELESITVVSRIARLLVLVSLLSPLAQADLIVGQIVDSNGVGVPGVDIDAKNLLGGGDPDLLNDGTDANGFFATTIPAGLYRLTFNPPPPPASTHLILDVEDVLVTGTTNLGVIALPPGVALSGHVQTTTGLPVAGVNIDIIDLDTNDNIALLADSTNAFGDFLVAAPLGAVELRINAKPVAAFTLASTTLTLNLATATNVGNIVLQPGFHVTALVKRTNGTPVVGADADVTDVNTKVKLYTPGDNSSATGLIDVVIPAGTYDFEVCPLFANKLVAQTVQGVVVTGATNLGTLTLANGFVLSGTVKNGANVPVGKVDVDVKVSATGASVTLCGDDSATNGTYAVVVPAGNFNVTFTPPFSLPYGTQTHLGVPVSGNTVLNTTLPDCAFATNYGTGLAGLGGFVPALGTSGGAPVLGNPAWTIAITGGRGGATATLILGFGPASFPFKQGTLLVDIASFPWLALVLPLSGPVGTPGAGAFNLTFSIPPEPFLAGFDLYVQAAIPDAAGVAGFALSNGLHVEFCQ